MSALAPAPPGGALEELNKRTFDAAAAAYDTKPWHAQAAARVAARIDATADLAGKARAV